uniref:EF-hand domain-containing protein n=1 Tax=Timema bartmani TaxID=61472 RepID=A0A7R9EU00_9NEOP|nr:unnamed protein product [Timema bartmani]
MKLGFASRLGLPKIYALHILAPGTRHISAVFYAIYQQELWRRMLPTPSGLEEKQVLRERWLQEMFDEAATDSSGCLDERTAISLIQKLSGSGHITTVRIKQKLAEFDQTKLDGRRGTIDSKEFIDMFKEVATRPEIYFLLIRVFITVGYAVEERDTLADSGVTWNVVGLMITR